jgi:predicted MFS family arabinose efflux permease
VKTDSQRLFAARMVRMFAYGSLSVVLALYLAELGFTPQQIGLLLTLTLIGDTVISLWITTAADRIGRKRMLLLGSALMVFAGALFVTTRNFVVLLIAATIGVISPSGNEVGPFLAIEQGALAQLVAARRRTRVFAWYHLAGALATAFGALFGGAVAELVGYRTVVAGYATMGLVLVAFFCGLSPNVETKISPPTDFGDVCFGLHRSRGIVARLASLFALDAFAGGFVMQSLLAYWFHAHFGTAPGLLGRIFFGANLVAAVSSLLAAKVAARFGLLNTVVFTHLPSNVLLMLVPLMPNLPSAITVLLLRFSISQMDVPTRQSYTMAVVDPDERSAAAGITGIARTTGASLSPVVAAPMLARAAIGGMPFFLAGGLKIVYDLLLYHSFRALRPTEEKPDAS